MDWSSRRLVRWLMTQWCNYRCWYCRQDHARDQQFRSGKGHWADNRPLQEWTSAFLRHLSGSPTTFTLTGGEPLLDRKNTEPLLDWMCQQDWIDAVRIDTNASWNPRQSYAANAKLHLMCSWHPTEIPLKEFLGQLDTILDWYWKVEMVTLVVLPERVHHLTELRRALNLRKVPLSAMPAYGTLMYYTPSQVEALKDYIPPQDWHFRTGGSTIGVQCSYPSLAYELYPDGSLEVACHPHLSGSLWDQELLTIPRAKVPCPLSKCTCVDRYTFSMDVNESPLPMADYARRIPLC